MRKILVTTFATVLLLSSIASTANLMNDEKSKTYDYKTALQEINDSMTAVGMVETDTAIIIVKLPFLHSFPKTCMCRVYYFLLYMLG